jgi:hypothetical protein
LGDGFTGRRWATAKALALRTISCPTQVGCGFGFAHMACGPHTDSCGVRVTASAPATGGHQESGTQCDDKSSEVFHDHKISKACILILKETFLKISWRESSLQLDFFVNFPLAVGPCDQDVFWSLQ